MSFLQQLRQALNAAAVEVIPGTPATANQVHPIRRCGMCRHSMDMAPEQGGDSDVCVKCQRELAQGYAVRSLAGRCADGAERDHGTRFHALPLVEGQVHGRALCGAVPGRRSAGWSEWGHGENVTCPRCMQKLSRHRG